VLDRETGQFQLLRDNPADAAIVYQLFSDHAGVVWVVTTNDLKRLDPAKERLTGYLSRAVSASGNLIASGGSKVSIGIRPISVGEDRQGSLWLGTNDSGLYRFDPGTGQFTHYRANPADPRSLSNGRVNSTYADRAGRIWVATQNGLDELDLKTGKSTAYYERDGLAGNVANCILADDRDELWISTNKGISRFDPLRKTFKNYTVADGLPGADLTGYPACFKSPSGEMFFAGFDGATAFHPDRVVEGAYVPPVVLTEFRLFGKRVEAGPDSPLKESITRATALTLPYNQNSFSLEFAALYYFKVATNHYRYKLEGLDGQWNEVDSNERLVTYPATPPGDYTFRVQAASARGGHKHHDLALRMGILQA
jgi:streptogramin lyase